VLPKLKGLLCRQFPYPYRSAQPLAEPIGPIMTGDTKQDQVVITEGSTIGCADNMVQLYIPA
jgi:hypothetical protein